MVVTVSETWLEPYSRSLLCSKTRSGKSTVMLVFASYFERSRILFVDVKRRYSFPGAHVARGVGELDWTAWRQHFIPVAVDSPDDRRAEDKEWHELFTQAADEVDLAILLDECVPKPAPATGASGALVRIIGQKKVDRVGVHACTGRWRGMSRELVAHADVIVVWPGGLSGDELKELARETQSDGQTLADAEAELRTLFKQARELGEHAFVMWDRNRQTFRIVPPLPEHLLERTIATEVEP